MGKTIRTFQLGRRDFYSAFFRLVKNLQDFKMKLWNLDLRNVAICLQSKSLFNADAGKDSVILM
jgi:hypothetical protein